MPHPTDPPPSLMTKGFEVTSAEEEDPSLCVWCVVCGVLCEVLSPRCGGVLLCVCERVPITAAHFPTSRNPPVSLFSLSLSRPLSLTFPLDQVLVDPLAPLPLLEQLVRVPPLFLFYCLPQKRTHPKKNTKKERGRMGVAWRWAKGALALVER